MKNQIAYLYCFQMAELGVAKVGTTYDPPARYKTLSNETLPYDFTVRHLLEVQSRQEADAWERHVLAKADRHRNLSEWVQITGVLDDLFAAVTPSRSVVGDFEGMLPTGRKPTNDKDTMTKVYRARALSISQAGGNLIIARGQTDEQFEVQVIHHRLSQGYGVFDIEMMDAIKPSITRAEISKLTKNGTLLSVMSVQPTASDKTQAAQ